MASARILAISLMVLVPAAAIAHGSGPDLHVDPSVDDCSVRFAPELTQSSFHRFVREFGSVSAFKQGSGPSTLSRWGVAVDAQYVWFSVDEHSTAWNDTFVHPTAEHPLGSNLSMPKLRVRVGVTDDLDVGAYYTRNPNANYGWVGIDAKYALLRQGDEMPVALSVRGAYTKTLYVSDMDMHSATADVTVGRTFWNAVTPYVGVGGDYVYARETTSAVDLDHEAVFVPHATAGLEARIWHVALGGEVQLATINSYQLQASVVF